MNPPPAPTPFPEGIDPADLLKSELLTESSGGDTRHLFQAPPIAVLAPLFPSLEILELIGEGGMGAVYKARQKELDRMIALKILPEEIGDDPAFSGQFTREAKALAKLNHPHIVSIHEFGNREGLYYIIMEYVDGTNLRNLMTHGLITPTEALDIVPQICDALQYAHDSGIVHRDIKPENILLNREGKVKVADFGLAKLKPGQQMTTPGKIPTSEESSDTLLSRDGKVMGTPAYMSPEQRETPDKVDHRADIYALGVVFYQMLTGELPGDKISSSSRKTLETSRLDGIVLKAMERNPEKRYQQASLMKTSLATLSSEAPRRKAPLRILALSGLAGIALGAAFGMIPAIKDDPKAILLIIPGAVLLTESLAFYRRTSQASLSEKLLYSLGPSGLALGAALGIIPSMGDPRAIILLFAAGTLLLTAALLINIKTHTSS